MKTLIVHESLLENNFQSNIEQKLQKKLSLHDSNAIAALIFFESDYASLIDFQSIKSIIGKIPIIGCSSDGEFSSEKGFQEDSILIAVLISDDPSPHNKMSASQIIVESISSKNEKEISLEIRDQVNSDTELLIFFSESLYGTSGDSLARSITHVCKNSTVVLGGMAADSWNFNRVYQLFNSKLQSDSLVALAFNKLTSNSLLEVSNGFKGIGTTSVVTRSKKNYVFRIGNFTATEYYESHLGSIEGSFGEYPIEVEYDQKIFLRAPLNWSTSTGAIEFAGDVPSGSLVRLTATSRTDLINSSQNSLEIATSKMQTEPSFVFSIICAARKHILGSKAQEEIDVIAKCTAINTPFFGFYSFGEYIKKAKHNNEVQFLNESATYCLVPKKHI